MQRRAWRLLAGCVVLAAAASPRVAAAQRVLAEAAREGARAMTTARLDRLGDMATTDLAPLDDGPSGDGASDPDAWPGAVVADTAWSRCDLEAPAREVDLRAGSLLPMQVSVASRGARAVALVALGRPGSDRHGMAFPESRWVEWGRGRVEVLATRGFFPGAALALNDRGATVLAYSRPDPRTPAERASRVRDVDIPTTLSITQLDRGANITRGPNEIEGSDGWDIDSPLVPWRFGTAVVLGRATNPPDDRRRREFVHFLDARGHPVRAPLELTDQARDDGLGAPLTGLTASPDERSLAATWAVPSGPLTGVWVRRGITLDARPFIPGTARIVDGPPRAPGAPRDPRDAWYPRGMWSFRVARADDLWGPMVTRGGVMFRRTRPVVDDAPLADLVFAPWPRDRHQVALRALGPRWDGLAAWTPGGPVALGLAPPRAERALEITWTRGRAQSLERVRVPVGDPRLEGLDDAVDVALCPTDDGALLVWIAAPDDTANRRLEYARLACAREARARRATSAASTPGSTTAPAPR